MNKALLTALTGLCLAGSVFAQTPADIPPGLIAWWRGQNNVQDTVGTDHGAVSGSLDYIAGKVGDALDFTGDENVLFPGQFVLHRPGDATVMFWLKSTFTANQSLFWTRADSADTNRFNISVRPDNFLAIDYRTPAEPVAFQMLAPTTPNVWLHVAIVRTGNTYTVFTNGVSVVSATDTVANLPTATGWQMSGQPGFKFTGELDELASFTRALSGSELAAIHAAGTAGMNLNKPYFTIADTLPAGGVGTPYSLQFAAAVTPGPHTFALTGGTMPPGLDLHADGLLHGTPTAAATASLNITATSSLGQTNTRTFSLNVIGCLDPAPTGMVAWWRGQDDALDAAGGHQGLLLNNVSFAPGKVGKGFTFGQNGKLFVPHSPTLANQQFTLEAWARPNGPPPGISNDSFGSILIYKPTNGDAESLNLYWRATDNRFSFIFGNSSTNRVISTNSFPPGQFYHVAASYDGAVFRLHVNGVLEGQQALVKTIPYNAAEGWNIGNCSDSCIAFGYERRWVGVLDEISIYNRALSTVEIAAIHGAGIGGKCGALHLTTLSPLPNAGQGAAYTQSLAVSGGTAPFAFTLLSGTLPAGLTLSGAGVISGTPTGFGTSDFTVRVTDVQTRSAERHYSFKVNARPVLGMITNKSVDELALLSVPNPATDADLGDTLTYTLLTPPAGASINAAGTITWTPTEAQGPGVHTITTQVTDNGTPPLTAQNSFQVTVNELNVAPTLPAQTNKNVNELALLTVTNTASDADLPANGLTYTLLTPPAGASISPAGVITWTPTEAQGPGPFTITTQVTDNGTPPLSATNSFQVTVNEVNVAPTLPAQTNKNVNELALLTVTNTGSDTDLPANGLTYTLLTPPAGASISAAGVITWTPTEAQGPGVHTITTQVTDNGTPPLSATNSFQVTIAEVNVAPSLPAQANRNVNELALLTVNNTATDTDLPANGLTYTLLTPPAGASISAAGVITWTPTEAQSPGPFTITTQVTDNGTPPLSATNSFQVTVAEVNVAPVLPALPDRNTAELALMTVNATATDADLPANTLSYTLLASPLGASISSGGVITWTPAANQGPATHLFTVRVTDNGSPPMSATDSFDVTVTENNTAPVLQPQANRNVNELALLSVANPATDAEEPASGLHYSLLTPPAGASISAAGTITWTPTEAQGPGPFTITTQVTDNGTPPLSSTNSFQVTVVEVNVAPVLGALSNFTVNAGQTVSFTATATDDDLPANTRTFSLLSPPSGATIHPTSGAFSWVATTTTTIQVRVTDNGTPALSDTESFTVTVNAPPAAGVEIRNFRIVNNEIRFEVHGPPGNYNVMSSSDLAGWQSLLRMNGAVPPFNVVDPAFATQPRRFYQAIKNP